MIGVPFSVFAFSRWDQKKEAEKKWNTWNRCRLFSVIPTDIVADDEYHHHVRVQLVYISTTQ